VSNSLAITAVTAALSQMLQKHLLEDPDLAGVNVTSERPSKANTGSGRRLNLFLYHVSPNPALRNADLPFRAANGRLTRQPVVALSLNYLVTAFGKSDEEFDAQHVLARAMSILHDNGVLTRERIRAALGAYTSFPELQKSDLADQVEPVKLTPLAMTQEDSYRLWSTFQTPYRLSVGYEASLVLVERPVNARAAAPVRKPVIAVTALRRPRIDSVSPQILPVGGTLTIAGSELTAQSTLVRFANGDATPATLSDEQITVVPPAGLRAGVQSVRVIGLVDAGDPPVPHRVFESNVAAFMQAPRIQSPQPPIEVVLSSNPNQPTHQQRTLTLTVAPPVGRSQRVALIAGDRTIPREPPPATDPETTTTPVFTIRRELLGEHLLRLQVDGAETPLTVETDPASPRFGEYVGPLLRVISQ
jgi:Pvc16 N-terminal domain/IPT/TIG domain